MNTKLKTFLSLPALIIVSLTLVACDSSQTPEKQTKLAVNTAYQDAKTGRWYTQEQLNQGRQIFAENCAVCHGDRAEKTLDWKTPTASGKYPPPPLNGTAHAWHHPMSVLQMVVRKGGAPMGGVMPAWEDKLSEEEILAAIASFQAYWPRETYTRWVEMDQQSRK